MVSFRGRSNGGLARYVGGVPPAVEAVVRDSAHRVLAGGMAGAPVDTGRLRRSLRAVQVGPGHWRVGSDGVVYARIHDLGGMTGRGHHVHIQAKRYLVGSLEAEKPNMRRELERAVKA